MIVHHLASVSGGGAGRAAENLAVQLNQTGQTHRLFCPHALNPPWKSLFPHSPRIRGLKARGARLLLSLAKKGRPRSPEPLSLAQVGTVPPKDHEFWQCDVIHLHWLGNSWLDLERFATLVPEHIPVVWTMHDLNPVTAICHYPGSACTEISSGCGKCPWVGGLTGKLTLNFSFEAKKSFLRATSPYIVTICAWQDRLMKTAPLSRFAQDIRLIGYAFDASKYNAGKTRKQARSELGLDRDARYALLGAASLKNHRKGADLAQAALPPGWRWLSFGQGAAILPDTTSIHFGEITDFKQLALIYSAADIFVLPSREECLAQTGLEALANGTPVLTFADTGPADYVIPGETGLLAETKDSPALRRKLEEFASHPALQDQNSVHTAFGKLHAERFSPAIVRAQYNDLYTAARAKPRSLP